LQQLQLHPGFSLPRSYREFAKEYGYGRLCGLLIVYVPMEPPFEEPKHPDSLAVRSEELADMLREGVEDEYFEYEPDGSPELISRLIPFAITETGGTLAWDAGDQTAEHEYRIYSISPKLLAVRKGPGTLGELIEQCTGQRVKQLLGPGYEPLPAIFEPLEPVFD